MDPPGRSPGRRAGRRALSCCSNMSNGAAHWCACPLRSCCRNAASAKPVAGGRPCLVIRRSPWRSAGMSVRPQIFNVRTSRCSTGSSRIAVSSLACSLGLFEGRFKTTTAARTTIPPAATSTPPAFALPVAGGRATVIAHGGITKGRQIRFSDAVVRVFCARRGGTPPVTHVGGIGGRCGITGARIQKQPSPHWWSIRCHMDLSVALSVTRLTPCQMLIVAEGRHLSPQNTISWSARCFLMCGLLHATHRLQVPDVGFEPFFFFVRNMAHTRRHPSAPGPSTPARGSASQENRPRRAMILSSSARFESNPDTTIMRMSRVRGVRPAIAGRTSMPDISGIMMSNSNRSGCCSRAIRTGLGAIHWP